MKKNKSTHFSGFFLPSLPLLMGILGLLFGLERPAQADEKSSCEIILGQENHPDILLLNDHLEKLGTLEDQLNRMQSDLLGEHQSIPPQSWTPLSEAFTTLKGELEDLIHHLGTQDLPGSMSSPDPSLRINQLKLKMDDWKKILVQTSWSSQQDRANPSETPHDKKEEGNLFFEALFTDGFLTSEIVPNQSYVLEYPTPYLTSVSFTPSVLKELTKLGLNKVKVSRFLRLLTKGLQPPVKAQGLVRLEGPLFEIKHLGKGTDERILGCMKGTHLTLRWLHIKRSTEGVGGPETKSYLQRCM